MMTIPDLENIVARMRTLGVCRLRTAEIEIDLGDEPQPIDGGAPVTDKTAKAWIPEDGRRRPRLKKFEKYEGA